MMTKTKKVLDKTSSKKFLCNAAFPIPKVVWGDDFGRRCVGAYYGPDYACGVARCDLEPTHKGDHQAKLMLFNGLTIMLEWPEYASVKEEDVAKWVKG